MGCVGRKNAYPLLRAFVFVALACFLLLPELARADQAHEAADISTHDHSYASDHNEIAVGIAGDCHPGLDCIVSAVLTVHPNTTVTEVEATVPYFEATRMRKTWLRLFEPPPPRARF